MDADLVRRIRRAKRAQAQRLSPSAGRKKKCKIGKSCGATCIARSDVCAVDLIGSVSSDLTKTSKKVSLKRSAKEDQLSISFYKHLEENSFSIPGRSFTGGDVANMVNQAAAGLTGEAKENVDKMRKFVIEAGQGLFISTNSKDPSIDRGKPLLWPLSKDFISKLDKFYGEDFLRSLPSRFGVSFKDVKSFSDAKIAIEKAIKNYVDWLKSERQEAQEIRALINSGKGSPKLEKLLRSLERSRKDKDIIKEINDLRNYLSNLVISAPGIGGFTSPSMNSVVLIDSKGHGYNRAKKVKGEELQSRISYVISERAKDSVAPRDTHLFSHKGNGAILMNYVHEVGHQVHFKAGESVPQPPKDSVSLSRSKNPGISGYSRVGFPMSGAEAFAEAFVAFVFNPASLRENDEPLYNWVKGTFEKAYSSR